MLPQLAEVEKHFPDVLAVVGVHSAKFPGERAGGSLRSAVQRYEIDHPVVNDEDMEIWSSYAVRAWPTLMFLDPEGRVIGKHEGEASGEALIDAIEDLIRQYDEKGLIDRSPISGVHQMERPTSALAFPGKVLADEAGSRLFISDSGHNRILITGLDGGNPVVVGSGAEGLADGSFSEARFHSPEGLALDGETLYVADTRNHVIRRIDLKAQTVSTIAGTGEAGMGFVDAGPARSIDLRSPWDVAFHGGTLYIAMAGMHQIWALDLSAGMLRPYAGTGREDIRDADLEHARLAQPSGLSVRDGKLYFVDSETSSVRFADLPPFNEVRTIVGTGLFDFGDVDSIADQARLQHPLGLAAGDGVIYVADSYNHKIKRIYPEERRAESWLGDGTAGDADGAEEEARFHEPSGVSVAGDRLYIADTNNHAIRVADLKTGSVTTLAVMV